MVPGPVPVSQGLVPLTYKGITMSAIISWASSMVLSMITEELVKSIFLSAAKSVAEHSKYKWDDKLVKVLEEHFDD